MSKAKTGGTGNGAGGDGWGRGTHRSVRIWGKAAALPYRLLAGRCCQSAWKRSG